MSMQSRRHGTHVRLIGPTAGWGFTINSLDILAHGPRTVYEIAAETVSPRRSALIWSAAHWLRLTRLSLSRRPVRSTAGWQCRGMGILPMILDRRQDPRVMG